MIGRLIIYFWRLVIFALAIGLAYASAFVVFPYLDKRLPVFPVLIILYLLIAYVAIPAIIRIWRLVVKPNHIPIYITTPDGWPADPVNISIIAKDEHHLTKAMEIAGWYKADKGTLGNFIKEGFAIALNRPYLRAPFSKFYLFGRSFDVGYQKQRENIISPRARHHVRFWQLIDPPGLQHDHQYHYWLQYIRHLLKSRRQIWIGAAMDDVGPLAFRWHNFQLTHAISNDTNRERDLIISDLQAAGLVQKVTVIDSGEEFTYRGQNIGNTFIIDGRIKVVELKSNLELATAAQVLKDVSKK